MTMKYLIAILVLVCGCATADGAALNLAPLTFGLPPTQDCTSGVCNVAPQRRTLNYSMVPSQQVSYQSVPMQQTVMQEVQVPVEKTITKMVPVQETVTVMETQCVPVQQTVNMCQQVVNQCSEAMVTSVTRTRRVWFPRWRTRHAARKQQRRALY